LLGETNQPIYKDVTKSDLIEYWKTRWVIPRLEKLQHNLSTNELKI
jgi:hypothetical protein